MVAEDVEPSTNTTVIVKTVTSVSVTNAEINAMSTAIGNKAVYLIALYDVV